MPKPPVAALAWALTLGLPLAQQTGRADSAADTAQAISREAGLPNQGPRGRPLPLAASWNTGAAKDGYDPDYQLRLIESGHRLLPWFQLDYPQGRPNLPSPLRYYPAALKRCAALGLPISFISAQWESPLSDSRKYAGLPPASNPNVVDRRGAVASQVSPFGALEPWARLGKEWTEQTLLRRLQTLYPRPPKVLFLSNNEHRKLQWQDAQTDRRYPGGPQAGGEDKRQAVGDGWIKRYRALQDGMREGLREAAWRDNALFVGYDAFGAPHFGRWAGWTEYSLYTHRRIDPSPLAWDGGSVSYYTSGSNPSTDYTVWSPQIEAMNWVFMQQEAQRLNPGFWFEMSVWDGAQPGQAGDKRAFYAQHGQDYTPQRYAGMVKFGMWLLRPRLVREYRGWNEARADSEAYFLALVRAVDEIHASPRLQKFWRAGELVENPSHPHPYQENIPAEYAAKPRWFMLDNSLEPKRPWTLMTEIPLFSLALVLGKAPNREWLIYAHAPSGKQAKVSVSLPGYGMLDIQGEPAGLYYQVLEKSKTVSLIDPANG